MTDLAAALERLADGSEAEALASAEIVLPAVAAARAEGAEVDPDMLLALGLRRAEARVRLDVDLLAWLEADPSRPVDLTAHLVTGLWRRPPARRPPPVEALDALLRLCSAVAEPRDLRMMLEAALDWPTDRRAALRAALARLK